MAEQKQANEALNVEEALTQSEAFLIKNKKTIIGAVAAVIIVVVGIVMYKNLYVEPREEKAQAALFKGQEYFEADLYEQALNGDSIGFAGFVKVADEYSGTKAANLAKAYMGLCYAHLGQYDNAVKSLDSFNGLLLHGDELRGRSAVLAESPCQVVIALPVSIVLSFFLPTCA